MPQSTDLINTLISSIAGQPACHPVSGRRSRMGGSRRRRRRRIRLPQGSRSVWHPQPHGSAGHSRAPGPCRGHPAPGWAIVHGAPCDLQPGRPGQQWQQRQPGRVGRAGRHAARPVDRSPLSVRSAAWLSCSRCTRKVQVALCITQLHLSPGHDSPPCAGCCWVWCTWCCQLSMPHAAPAFSHACFDWLYRTMLTSPETRKDTHTAELSCQSTSWML